MIVLRYWETTVTCTTIAEYVLLVHQLSPFIIYW